MHSTSRAGEDYDDVASDACSMIESMRAYGYTLPGTLVTLAACLCLATHQDVSAQEDRAIVIGETATLQSTVLGEERTLYVHLPDGYEQSEEEYPVVYVLDGDLLFHFTSIILDYLNRFGRTPAVIVVGVLNTDRGRDLTPTEIATESSGGADGFLQFMHDELFPFVEDRYRTQPYRVLVGHSLAGMFAIYALLERPELFDAYIATSPSLWWDDRVVVRTAEDVLDRQSPLRKFLFINFGGGDSEYIKASTWRFAELLQSQAPRDMDWRVDFLKAEDHVTVPMTSFFDGLEALYADWRLPQETLAGGMEAIDRHYRSLSDRFGYEIPVPESAYNSFGYYLLGQERFEDAIEVFRLNVRLHPDSWNVYDSLGEAYFRSGNDELAKTNYERSLELNPLNQNAVGMLKRIERRQ